MLTFGRHLEVSLASAEKKATSALELLTKGVALVTTKISLLANSFDTVACNWAISYFKINLRRTMIAPLGD